MEKRIELELGRKSRAQIKELNLDNCRSTSIVGITDEFVGLECLSLNNVGLINLKGFPKLPNLKKLELGDNRISGGLNHLTGCPKLSQLNLAGNKIETIEAFEPLKDLKNLKSLDVSGCEVSSMENHKEKLFGLIPSLKDIDGIDQNGKETEISDEENGNASFDDESDLEDEDEDDVSDDFEEEEDEVGLSALQNSIDEDSEDDDYNPEGVNESDVDIDDDADEDDEDHPKGLKRKLENDD